MHPRTSLPWLDGDFCCHPWQQNAVDGSMPYQKACNPSKVCSGCSRPAPNISAGQLRTSYPRTTEPTSSAPPQSPQVLPFSNRHPHPNHHAGLASHSNKMPLKLPKQTFLLLPHKHRHIRISKHHLKMHTPHKRIDHMRPHIQSVL